MNRAEMTESGMEGALRAFEESADAANLLAMELAIGSFEAGLPCGDRLVRAAEHAVDATARMSRLVPTAGHF